MKIGTRLQQITKIGYTSEAKKRPAPANTISRLPYFEIETNSEKMVKDFEKRIEDKSLNKFCKENEVEKRLKEMV